MAPTTQESGNELLHLDPAKVRAGSNVRFNLKKSRIDDLAEDITNEGGIHTPVEVTPIEGVDGYDYDLVKGFYRHAAALKLNAEGAGLTLPALVYTPTDELALINRQVSENVQREDMSPMDIANTVKRLLELGVPRAVIRKRFARPQGRKTLTVQPASNAFLNMHVAFLDLPKSIQEKIHDGRLGTKAAYELTRVSPDRREAILERAEAERQAAIDFEDKLESKYQEQESKVTEAQKAAETVQTAAEVAVQAAAAAKARHEEARAGLKAVTITDTQYKKLPAAEQKTLKKRTDAAKEEMKEAEKAVSAAEADAKKLTAKAETAAELAARKMKELAEARKARPVKAATEKGKGKKGVSQEDIKRQTEKEAGQPVALKGNQIVQLIESLAVPAYPTVKAVCETLIEAIAGRIDEKVALRRLGEICKEPNAPKARKAS